MTDCGLCVVAALSNHTSGRPFTRSCRIGKSRRTAFTSNGGWADADDCGISRPVWVRAGVVSTK